MNKIFPGKLGSWFLKKTNRPRKSEDYIFYKIVDHSDETSLYKLQCINTFSLFDSSLGEIVFDLDILHGLHPIQACYIAIEFSRKSHSEELKISSKKNTNISRYGKYQLYSEDRIGNIHFFDKFSKQELVMDPRDIALTEELIEEFDASEAFYIGFRAGRKLGVKIAQVRKAPYLRLVKNEK